MGMPISVPFQCAIFMFHQKRVKNCKIKTIKASANYTPFDHKPGHAHHQLFSPEPTKNSTTVDHVRHPGPGKLFGLSLLPHLHQHSTFDPFPRPGTANLPFREAHVPLSTVLFVTERRYFSVNLVRFFVGLLKFNTNFNRLMTTPHHWFENWTVLSDLEGNFEKYFLWNQPLKHIWSNLLTCRFHLTYKV